MSKISVSTCLLLATAPTAVPAAAEVDAMVLDGCFIVGAIFPPPGRLRLEGHVTCPEGVHFAHYVKCNSGPGLWAPGTPSSSRLFAEKVHPGPL